MRQKTLSDEEARNRQLEAKKTYMKKFEAITVRFAFGTKDKIKELGYASMNNFVLLAVQEKLEREQNTLKK